MSNSRGPASLGELVRQLGQRAPKPGRARKLRSKTLVVVAVPWSEGGAALADLPAWAGRILIDATNLVVQPGFRLADLNGRNIQ